MKILYISNKYKRGEPKRGFSHSFLNFLPVFIEMNNKSNQIVYFPVDDFLLNETDEQVRERLMKIVLQEKPNLIFFDEGDLKKQVLKELKETAEKVGALTLYWASDDNWGFDIASKFLAPLFHWTVTTDSLSLEKYKKLGFNNVIHSQWACNHLAFKPFDLPKTHDVTFVGQPSGYRRKKIEKIKKKGVNVQCWGYGWPVGVVPFEGMLRIFSQSKINLNFAGSSGLLWKKTAEIFLRRGGERDRRIYIANPKTWPDRFKSYLGSFRTQLHGRNFEVPCCGGFLLTEYGDNLKDYYEIGKEIVCFDGIDDCVEKIKYYLSHDKERDEIAKAGYERTMRDHTYEKRFNEIFKIMGLEHK